VLALFYDPPPAEERELVMRLVTTLEHRFEAELAQLWAPADGAERLQLLAQNPTAPRAAVRELELADAASPIAEAAWSRVAVINPPATEGGAAANACLPLLHAGLLLGVLVYRSSTPFTEATLRVLQRFALLTAGSLHAAEYRRAEVVRKHLQLRLDAVSAVLEAVNSGAEPDRILALALERALELTGLDEGQIALVMEASPRLVVRASLGARHSPLGAELPPGDDVPHRVLKTGEPVLIQDYQEFPAGSAALRQRGARAVLGVPLRRGSRTVGVIQIASRKKARPIEPIDQASLEALALAVGAALRR
jgi:GAF domain-containing protein